MTNGAEALLQSLIKNGVEVCFANPGTSEMQLVAAIDKLPGMRPILCLFEGVASGAADGYARMSDKPAATLLHMGSGYSNSMANLHNARRAHTPIVNIVGDHAGYHLQHDAPLTSDVRGHAELASGWVRVAESADLLAKDGADAIEAALSGKIATLVVPADFAWSESKALLPSINAPGPRDSSPKRLAEAADAVRSGRKTALFLGGRALRARGLNAARRIAEASGAALLCETFPARIQRGRGRPTLTRLPYFGEQAAAALHGYEHLILIGATPPVSFFAYPGKPSTLWPEACELCQLATHENDPIIALETLAELIGAPLLDYDEPMSLPDIPDMASLAEVVGATVAELLPDQAIVSDEAATSGLAGYPYFEAAAPHDWLTLTGGAIGQGLPLAVGAAVACPERKVVSLQADGSAMYTNQALWTMAREDLDVVVVLFKNSAYAILNIELKRLGVENPGKAARSMFSLADPDLDWVKLAEGMGVSASRATDSGEFRAQFGDALVNRGPRLIEVVL